MTDGIPILSDKITDNVRREVWRINSQKYSFAKRPSDIISSFKFDSFAEAFKHAKFYKALVKDELYPPETRILMCPESNGKPTIIALMPFLKTPISYEDLEKNKERFDKIFEKYSIDNMLFVDVSCKWNYGMDENGKVYYHDLHLVFNNNTFKLPKNYKLPE